MTERNVFTVPLAFIIVPGRSFDMSIIVRSVKETCMT